MHGRTGTLSLSLVLLFSLACGDGGGGAGGPDGGYPDFWVPPDLVVLPDLAYPPRKPEAHPAAPEITYQGGHLLKQVQVTTIGWAGDPLNKDRADFAAWLVQSAYYESSMSEYGVSKGKSLGLYEIKEPPPKVFDDASVGPLLRKRFQDGSLPPPTASSLYLIYLPDGTESTSPSGRGCREYDGYHWQASTGFVNANRVAYAIMVGCGGPTSRFDQDTVTASHEIVEAASDPGAGDGWLNPEMALSEIGDLCTPLEITEHATLGDGTTRDYQVQRVWSAKRAAAGTEDPCVPVPPAPYVYFNAGIDPQVIDIATDDAGNGVATILVEPFAFGSVGTITWSFVLGPAKGVVFSKVKGSGAAGSTQPVKVTVLPTARGGVYPVWLESHAKGYRNVWFASMYVH